MPLEKKTGHLYPCTFRWHISGHWGRNEKRDSPVHNGTSGHATYTYSDENCRLQGRSVIDCCERLRQIKW